MILSSTGSAAEQQMTCLGVYRIVGDYNGKPLYKQDEGENYLYYQNKTWLVGPHLGVSHAGEQSDMHGYAWMKLDGGKSDGASSSSSSEESDSDSQEGGEKIHQKKTKTKRASMDIFREGWKYKSALMGIELSSHSDDSDDSAYWVGDDTTLKVEALKGG